MIAIWPFGLNPGISARIRAVPELPARYEQTYERELAGLSAPRHAVEWLRFSWRRPAPYAATALAELSSRRRIVLTTGRSREGRQVLVDWLARHGLDSFIDEIFMSPPGLTSRQHKLATLRMHDIDEHVDDDPTAISYLAAHGVSTLYLRTWPTTSDAELPAGASCVRGLAELVELIE